MSEGVGDLSIESEQGIIAWFIKNPVAANLLMMFIFVIGSVSAYNIKKKMFPDFETNTIEVIVAYPGATPEDVELGINLKVEDAINDIAGIKSVYSTAEEGTSQTIIEVETGFEIDDILDEVKTEVEGIINWPEDAEKAVIRKSEFKTDVIWMSLYGDVDLHTLHSEAQRVRKELLKAPEIAQVEIVGSDDLIVSIEVSENTLRRYGFTFSEIANMLREGSEDISAGKVKTKAGEIQLRTRGQAYSVQDYANIIIRSESDGGNLKLGDIATIEETFEDRDHISRFNGKPAISLNVKSTGTSSDFASAQAVRNWIEKSSSMLPKSLKIDYWMDMSVYLQGRLNMMLTNMLQGGVLVFIVLALFLQMRLAFWVSVGIPISFLGAIWLMPVGPFPVFINVISLFGFILVLGIVVDDAIVIGESVHSEIMANGHSHASVLAGVERVATPATFGVLTTIAAFAPILGVGGQGAPFFESISVVVVWCLLFSLLESKLILPAHLAHMKPLNLEKNTEKIRKLNLNNVQQWVNKNVASFVERYYEPHLRKAVQHRYVTLAIFIAIFMITIGVMKSSLLHFAFFPEVPMDNIQVNLRMISGTSPDERNKLLADLESKLYDLDKEYREAYPNSDGLVKHVLTYTMGDTDGSMMVEMTKSEDRYWDGFMISDRWREAVGIQPGVHKLDITASANAGGGKPLQFKLSSEDYYQAQLAAKELQDYLKATPGVYNIENSFERGPEEIVLTLKPGARFLGITLNDLGRQVRQGFYGEEVERFQRRDDEIKVLLRYPEADRDRLATLEKLRIKLDSGQEIPIEEVATLTKGQGFSKIRRRDGRRSVAVFADVDPVIATPGVVMQKIQKEILPEILKKYAGVEFGLEGASLEEQKTTSRLLFAAITSLFLIYALIAIPLKSYIQPLIIMAVIPFGLTGAVFGHIVFGLTMSMMSLYGLVALAGVLVNDSLVLIDYINEHRKGDAKLSDVIIASGGVRFRAIFLTSVTTFLGLAPIMLERSTQAQIIIPMAVSLAFGILFATFITLFLIPTLYMMVEDIKALFTS